MASGGRPGRDGGGRGTGGSPGCWGYVGVQCRGQRRKKVWGHVPAIPLPFRVSRGGHCRGATTTPGFLHKGGGWRSLEENGHPGRLHTVGGLELARVLQRPFWRAQWGRRYFLGASPGMLALRVPDALVTGPPEQSRDLAWGRERLFWDPRSASRGRVQGSHPKSTFGAAGGSMQ